MQRSRALAGAALVLVNVLLLFIVVATLGHLGGADRNSTQSANQAAAPEKESFAIQTTGPAPARGAEKAQDRAPSGWLPSISRRLAVRRQIAPRASRNAASGALWNYEGSVLRLEATGRSRRFYFANPGGLVFEGVREGQAVFGQAFSFTQNCAPIGYRVRGSASLDEATVKMHGKKPRRDARCAVSGYEDIELVFTLADGAWKPGSAASSLASAELRSGK